jgi:hypothetical protein
MSSGKTGTPAGSTAGPTAGSTATPSGGIYDAQPSYRMEVPADPSTIQVADTSYFGWALLDRASGVVTGSTNFATTTNSAESMVKPFIVGDYLKNLAAHGQTPSNDDLNEMTLAIIDSNDDAAEDFYERGGGDDVMQRMIDECKLTDTTIVSGYWWATQMSPNDAARYGQCIADGRVAGPQWTNWLLTTMKQIRGGVDDQVSEEVEGGRWGIIDGLPPALASEISFKNGWTSYEDGWHVNCMAIAPTWVLTVMMRYDGDLAGAASGCASVASALVVKTND